MKKILSALTLVTILGASAPAFAAPPPPPNHGGQSVHAGYKHHNLRRHPHHHGYYRPHNSFSIYTNYSHRLAFPYCRCPYCMAHRPQSGVGFYFSF